VYVRGGWLQHEGAGSKIWTQDWRSGICKNPRIKFCGLIAYQEFLFTADGGGVRVSSLAIVKLGARLIGTAGVIEHSLPRIRVK
jgi:hypothetical protein